MDFTSFVKELEIDKMPEDKQKTFFEGVFRTLNMRISFRLAHELNEEQIKQLDQLASRDDQNALKELEKAFPNFNKIYQEEIDGLKDDIKTLL